MGAQAAAVAQETARARAELSGRILAVTLRAVRDPDIAEEATADAFVAALETWPRTGIPDSVEAWLVTVARRKALDRVRRDQLARRMATRLVDRTPQVAPPADARIEAGVIGDEELRLTVLCADPRLPESDQVALTLRWACGVSTAAIAAAHLVSVPTMAARLTRARKKLMAAGPQLDLPDDATVDARLPLVCRVVQLAYTLGHTAAEGTGLTDEDLAGRAVHLARTLHRQRPTDPEITGLLALVVLGQGRAAGRIGVDGRQLLLTDVDRGTWDPNLVTEGLATSELALAQGIAAGRAAGPIALQAAISAAHTRARAFAQTDWQLDRRVVRDAADRRTESGPGAGPVRRGLLPFRAAGGAGRPGRGARAGRSGHLSLRACRPRPDVGPGRPTGRSGTVLDGRRRSGAIGGGAGLVRRSGRGVTDQRGSPLTPRDRSPVWRPAQSAAGMSPARSPPVPSLQRADDYPALHEAVHQRRPGRGRRLVLLVISWSGAGMADDKVTIYDVAERAGVSISTVSYVINRPERVSDTTQGQGARGGR